MWMDSLLSAILGVSRTRFMLKVEEKINRENGGGERERSQAITLGNFHKYSSIYLTKIAIRLNKVISIVRSKFCRNIELTCIAML